MSIFPKLSESDGLQEIGTFYDWAYDTGAVTGKQFLIVRLSTGSMPIHGSHKRGRDGRYHTGGPWIMVRERTVHEPVGATMWRYGRKTPAYVGWAFYNGTIGVPSTLPSDWKTTASLNSRFSTVGGKGAEAWNRMRPDKPDFSAATSLLELKDLVSPLKSALKHLIERGHSDKALKRALNTPLHKKAGNDHLMVNFGLVPLVSDIKGFVEAFEKRHKKFNEMLKNEGKPRHRRTKFGGKYDKSDTIYGTFPRSGNSLTTVVGLVDPAGVSQCYTTSPSTLTRRANTTTREEWWAEGQFRYLLPPGPRTDAWKASMVRRILGGRVTLSTVYNLIPWSWLVDYFTDVGDMMDAISPGIADRLICDYAYVMATFEWELFRSDESSWAAGKTGGVNIVSPSVTKTWTIKMRYPASPFGFGFSMSNLTPNQIGILGALGLSKI